MRIHTSRHAPGTAPGTLPERARALEPAVVHMFRYGLDEVCEEELVGEGPPPPAPASLTTWIDVQGHDVQQLAEFGRHLDLHPLILEDVINVGQRPKVEDYDDSIFIVLDHYAMGDDNTLGKEQVSVVIQRGSVLSIRERQSGLFESVRQRLRAGKPRIRGGGVGYLAYALIDTVVDHFFPVLDRIGDLLEELEESILEEPTSNDRATLHHTKRDLLVLRKSVWPLRDMLRNLMVAESALLGDETLTYLRDVADHAALALDIIETYREMVSSLNDLYLSSMSNRMNEVMKVLTIIATIFIPLS
ncbi:MAG: magnesium/cobalt transporter CorA, partial [Thermoanaerobaculales bacterium]|nr:magnesium/cobalt transporter CorA [Thermoanaerobaculales bacterium]